MNFGISIQQVWNIRLPIVYRYMDQRHVDEFFATGRLRLSCFSEFRRHPDEHRGDPEEGSNLLIGAFSSPAGEQRELIAGARHGSNAYVLSATTREDDDLATAFKTDGLLRITDTTQFGCAIAHEIPLFRGGMEGPCLYRQDRIVHGELGTLDLDPPAGETSMGMNRVLRAAESIAPDGEPFFVKHASYSYQSEYRLVWTVAQRVTEPLFVTCPAAREFCDRG